MASRAPRHFVYVAAPIDRGDPSRPRSSWSTEMIDQIRMEAKAVGIHVLLPEPEDDLDTADASVFHAEIVRRIEEAGGVISILGDGDAASIVEATLAATHERPQLILAKRDDQVPRLLRGIPGLTEVVAAEDAPTAEIRRFLKRARDDDWDKPPRGSSEPRGRGGPHRPRPLDAPPQRNRPQLGW